MGKDGSSCGCTIGLIVAVLVLRFCWSIGKEWGISPVAIIISAFVVLFILMWVSGGLKGAVAFFGAVIFIVILVTLFIKWIEFVDKHIKD